MELPILNLPAIVPKLVVEEGKEVRIYDEFRKKLIVLTPEEWVRQHFLHFLVLNGYSKSLIQVERGHHFHKRNKRTDVVAFSRSGEPYLLVECKSPYSKLDPKVLFQAITYNHTLHARFVCITNGLDHVYFEINSASHEKAISRLESIPMPD